jgi:hypothetical protein
MRESLRAFAWFVVGSVLGGLSLAAFLFPFWILLRSHQTARLTTLFTVMAISLTATLFPSLRWLLPDRRHQVSPELLMKMPIHHVSLKWGLELGAGVRTLSVTPALYAVLGITVVQPSAEGVVLIPAAYAASRAAAIAVFAQWKGRVERRGNGELLVGVALERAMRIPLVAAIALSTISASGLPW